MLDDPRHPVIERILSLIRELHDPLEHREVRLLQNILRVDLSLPVHPDLPHREPEEPVMVRRDQPRDRLLVGLRRLKAQLLNLLRRQRAGIGTFLARHATLYNSVWPVFVSFKADTHPPPGAAREVGLGGQPRLPLAPCAPRSCTGMDPANPNHPDPNNAHDDLPVIEGYGVIDLIGRGGMGAVYEAFQQSTGRRVAVKLMLERAGATEAARRRFEREVELIARLQHPGIVGILDSGIHKGRYFYVMEFVEGRPLDDAMPPGHCAIRDALRVIAKVARAVEYAHQRGVMHRDLKPSNIIIDKQGEPHLLDFGLAKAFDPHSLINLRDSISEPGQVIGTLGYMSPEQARGAVQEVSVRADVYALGAIAYEILVGSLPCPIDGPMAIVFHRIESRDPDRPSTIRKGVDADVDAILMKALEKKPASRYATAAELADDIERWLDNRPIRARRTSSLHRGARWCRRNPALAGVIVAGLLLVAALGFAAWRESVSREKERLAAVEKQREIQKQEATDDMLLAIVKGYDPDKGPGLADEAHRVLTQLEQNLHDIPRPPEREAPRREDIGILWKKWGNNTRSLANLNRALELNRALFPEPSEPVARCLYNICGTNYFYWRLDEAEKAGRAALDMRLKVHTDSDSLEVADSKNFLAQTLGKMRRFDEARALQQQAIDSAVRRMGEGSEKVTSFRNNFGTILKDQGDFAAAERIYTESLATLRSSMKGQRHWHMSRALLNIAVCRMEQGIHDSVEPLLIEAEAIAADFLGGEHPDLALVKQQKAALCLQLGRLDEADAAAAEAFRILDKTRGPQHPETISARLLRGKVLAAEGKSDQAEREIRNALDHRLTAQPVRPADAAEAKYALAEVLMIQNRHAEALSLLREAWPILERELGPKNRRTAACITLLAQALEATGDKDAAAYRDRARNQ